MLTRSKEYLAGLSAEKRMFWIWACVLISSFVLAVSLEVYLLVGVPVLMLLAYVSMVDVKKVFLLLMASIPLSTEVVLPNGFGTDLPTEPFIIGLMGVAGVIFFFKLNQLRATSLLHPITLLLLAHLFWIYFTTFQSDLVFTSIKFSLAKTWYIAVFYFLAIYLMRSEEDWRTLLWWVFWPLVFSVVVIMVRHAGVGFSFDQVHKVLHPFQRNHVSYAATLALFVPFLWYFLGSAQRYSHRWWALVWILIGFLVAIYLTYTRAAYVAILLAGAAFFIFRLRLIRVALVLGVLVTILSIGYLLSGSRYLEYAPNYDTTVTHREFGSLLEATAKGEDISTMERVYRWVAAVQMSGEAPFVGFGPGNFVQFYKSYAISSFETYVSGNPEQSGVHSYFLLMLVEQGWPGLFLFLALSMLVFVKGEDIYHETKDRGSKRLVMAALLVLVVIYAFLIINDMVETDKVGSFFFLCFAILVRMDLLNRRMLLEQTNTQVQGE